MLELRKQKACTSADAPDIVASLARRYSLARDRPRVFRLPGRPTSFTTKTVKKYTNALDTFADWAAAPPASVS